MFAGFRSRWMMPCSCAASSASAICFAMGKRLVERHRAARDALRQIVALDEFHHERGHAPAFFEAVDGGDVRMIQRREHFRFALKAREPIGIGRERGRQDLDRDLTFQPRVGRPIHLPHPAFADLRGDFVDAEARAGGEGQLGVIIRAGPESGRDDS